MGMREGEDEGRAFGNWVFGSGDTLLEFGFMVLVFWILDFGFWILALLRNVLELGIRVDAK